MNELDEKIAVSDTLSGVNTAISMFTYAILQANNVNFRDTLIQTRNEYEQLQYNLYLIAKKKGYYVPAAPAGVADIEQVQKAISE